MKNTDLCFGGYVGVNLNTRRSGILINLSDGDESARCLLTHEEALELSEKLKHYAVALANDESSLKPYDGCEIRCSVCTGKTEVYVQQAPWTHDRARVDVICCQCNPIERK